MEHIVLMSKGGKEKEGKKTWYWVGINTYRTAKLTRSTYQQLDPLTNNKLYVLTVDWSYI